MKHNNKSGDMSNMEENLKKQFDDLGENVTAPEDLKTEVFNTLDTLTLVGDFLDLFTAKFTESELNIIDTISSDDEM